MDLKNSKTIDISKNEKKRIYVFPLATGKTVEVEIENPKYLIVSSNGHRIVDEQNISHYIPNKWIHLYWENKNKNKPFIF